MDNVIKPGIRTSEFWLTVVFNLATLTASVATVLAPRYAAIASAISVGLYTLARGLAKINSQPPAKR